MGLCQPNIKIIRPLAVVTNILIFLIIFSYSCNSDTGKEAGNLPEIKEQIKKFRAGEEFNGDASAYIVKGQPDSDALRQLREALAKEDDAVREQIFRLIAEIGKRVDPLYEKGGDLIRDRSIINILVNDGLSQTGSAMEFCLDQLQYSVPPAILHDYGEALTGRLRQSPDATLLLVIAKAKPAEAREAVDKLMENPGWAKELETRIASAALGNKEIETEFIKTFLETSDPEEKADYARFLGFIGTPGALKALASEMRTDMVLQMTGVSRRSVRIFIIEGLKYNYPDRTFLYDNAVNSDEDYARIEKFCEEEFGVNYTKDRPPFLWIQGFPSEPPPSQ